MAPTKTIDANALLSEYRSALSMLWNNFFSKRLGDLASCGALDDFEEIDRHLFRGLVLSGLGREYWKSNISHRKDSVPFLVITVKRENGHGREILLAKQEANRNWTRCPEIRGWEKLRASFVEVFEWGMYKDQLSFPFYVGQISEFPGNEQFLNWYCLVPVDIASVELKEKEI
jgi:hypothetical protein